MHHRRLAVASLALAVLPLAAQSVESLALPDIMDSRDTVSRTTARIAELTREEALQRSRNNHALANQIAATVALLNNQRNGTIPIPPGTGVELHAVSFYEGAQGTPRTARVSLTRAATPVVLLLNAYDPITWTLDPLPPGVLLAGVVVLSYEPQALLGVPGTVPVVTIDRSGGGTYYGRPDMEGRTDVLLWSLTRLGLLPATFQGVYTAPSGPFEVGPGSADWREQMVLAGALAAGQTFNHGTRGDLVNRFATQFFFPLVTPPMRSAGGSRLVLANPYGPLTQPYATLNGVSTYAIAPGPSVYVLHNRAPSTLNLANLIPTPIPPDPTLPPFSWVTGLTHDGVRNRILVSGFGGVGHLYAWDIATSRWSLVNTLNNVDLGAIAHHAALDTVFGIDVGTFGGGPFRLRAYDAAGTNTGTQALGLHTWGGATDSFQLFQLGASLALVGPGRTSFGVTLRHAFVVDPASGDIAFATFWIG
jgi:hypothetical protein